ncbi:PAS domain-containing protein [Algoriphagus terrigena]|uniref:PAS domain-containing protein n=1 Tax=Algoriphagus terrigena TaxID=344884 RepID=UPI00146FBA77|nr:PAS domain-containing protein [Algoriphagus terrigena]
MKRIKDWIFRQVYSNPKFVGSAVFLISLSLSLFLCLAGYQLKLSTERELVNDKLNEFENLLINALHDGISASKTLGFIAQNQRDVVQNFQSIGQQLLDSNPLVDAIQLLDEGTIVAVYPMQGNESVIGYDVLSDPKTKNEVEEAIRRREVYFSGPITLKQGGIAIVGRYPLFDGGRLTGLAAVIIKFEDLLQAAKLQESEKSPFAVQFSKLNPNSNVLEKFLSENPDEVYTGHRSSVLIDAGNWNLSVQLKKSTAVSGLIWKTLLSLVGSTLFAFLVWSFARQPVLLEKKVAEQSKEILDANERFELAVKATSGVIWDWDLLSNQTYRSEHFFEILGYDKDETTGNNDFWLSIIHPEERERAKKQLDDTLRGNDQYWNQEFRVKRKDNSYAYIIDQGYIIRDENGKAIRMIGSFQDISAQKTAELELLRVNERLSSANEELQVFAALASHDLREPLRMISSFLSLLEKKYGSTLDEKANQYISFAIDGAKRLTTLIHDLLEYSKVGFEQSAIEKINTGELVGEVLKLTSNLIRESDAAIIVVELPDIQGVPTPIRLLFQNLIGNALKYRHPELRPRIEISGRESEKFWEFSIEDNGIGIEADYLEPIFGVLKRLHPKEKYPGTGLGLATCRKIVTQHGGKIWAESTVGVGSKFLFTIKKHE